MDKIQALHSFWSSFGISAYDETSVPDEMSFTNPDNKTRSPYITYEVSIGEFGEEVVSSASVWYYGAKWNDIDAKIKQIEERFKNGGVIVRYDEGTIWIKKSAPFLHRVGDTNDMVRRYLVNTIIEYH